MRCSSSLSERNRNSLSHQSPHAAFRTSWPWLEPNTSVLVSRAAKQSKLLLSCRDDETVISPLWWVSCPQSGFVYSAWLTHLEGISTERLRWKCKSGYIICLRWWQHIRDKYTGRRNLWQVMEFNIKWIPSQRCGDNQTERQGAGQLTVRQLNCHRTPSPCSCSILLKLAAFQLYEITCMLSGCQVD